MNRKARRAGLKSSNIAPTGGSSDRPSEPSAATDLMAQATALRRRGQPEQAQDICNRILAREPAHVNALNLLGLMLQASGRHRLAAKTLSKAVTADPLNAACHYNLASSLQALNDEDEATVHFKKAIAFGARLKGTEDLILQNPAITICVDHIEEKWPLPVKTDELFARYSLESIASDVFLRCALTTVPLRGAPLEKFLTHIRAAQLRAAMNNDGAADGALVRLFCALAQQCFINEYVFAQSADETWQSNQLRDLLLQKLRDGDAIPPLLLAGVAAYYPLHSLSAGPMLLDRDFPEFAADVVRLQLREPLQEMEDRNSIPSLTSVDDGVSLQVMQQYEENPYPRWTIDPSAGSVGEPARGGADEPGQEILIAGCGTGQHAFEIAYAFPGAKVLAVDISLPSLAYARRKTREAGLHNVEYAKADILKLAAIGRSFDRIEAGGVLHHLADPESGWRALLALLRPKGEMRVGLYSDVARSAVGGARDFIAARGYRPTAEDIRKCRQEILRDYEQLRWRSVIESPDFYSMSGCRDLLFHVMEHRFTIPRIKTFLNEQSLAFLGFNLDPQMIEKFQKQFPESAALTDLDKWQAFEADNPRTFRHMYVFTVRKN
jgi:SAM-dependent methyltransferase